MDLDGSVDVQGFPKMAKESGASRCLSSRSCDDVKPAEQERLEADFLLRSLHEAHCEDERHRRWLLRRWPAWPTEGLNDSVADAERFIPECFLRDGEDDVSQTLRSITNLIKGGLDLLQGEDEEGGLLDVPQMVRRLSDEGLFECIPLLFPRLERNALQSILSILTNRKRVARNRPWLIVKSSEVWRTFSAQYSEKNSASRAMLAKILAVVRKENSFCKDTVPGQLVLEEASCPWSAARSALTPTQLEQLPLQCLHVMLEVLLEKPVEVIVGKLPAGGNKERLVTALMRRSEGLLCEEDDEAGEALPEPLRKCLVVMSVSARYAYGDDGKLVDFLGPLPVEMTTLQDSLLSALSCVKQLNYKNLQLVHKVLNGSPRIYKLRHPGNLRHSIKRILLDCLLRSVVRSVPEKVKKAAETIRTLAVNQPVGLQRPVPSSNSRLKLTLDHDAKIDLEVESTLQISSHLLQIMYNWNDVLSERSFEGQECQQFPSRSDPEDCSLVNDGGKIDAAETTPGISPSPGIRSSKDGEHLGEECLAIHMKHPGDEDMRLGDESFDETAQLPRKRQRITETTKKPGDFEDIGGKPGEEEEEIHLTRIADEAAQVAYALVGSAMERTARFSGISLKRPVRKYLRSGTVKKVRTGQGEGTNVEEHQLAMILKIAGKIPGVSPRVIGNVKKRLSLG